MTPTSRSDLASQESLPFAIAPMTPNDLDEVMALERRCFTDPWTRRMYLSDLTDNPLATYLVIRVQPALIVAYGGYWLMGDEAHIATVASHPDWRGCGLGQSLTVALMEAAQARGARLATLEVRAGNAAAQGLYRKLGFAVEGVRKHYYRDGEDGIIMTTPPLADAAMQKRLKTAQGEALDKLTGCLAVPRQSSNPFQASSFELPRPQSGQSGNQLPA